MALDLARRLCAEGLLTDEELNSLVARRALFGEPVPVAMRALHLASPKAVEDVFDRMGYAPVLRLRPAAAAKKLPAGMMRALWAVPVGENEIGFVVAMADPTDAHALHELAFHLGRPVDPRTASLDELRRTIDQIDPVALEPRVPTRPAPAAPPPDMEYAPTVLRNPTPASAKEELVVMAKRPAHRRLTPAYGELSGVSPQIPALGVARADVAVPRMNHKPRILNVPGGTIGGVPTAPTAPPLDGSPNGDLEVPIPLAQKRPRRPVQMAAAPTSLPDDALHVIADLRQAEDRDTVARLASRGMLSAAKRAAFFVVKRGVVQGWEGATTETTVQPGLAREALRNLWIPVTSHGVFRKTRVFVGSLSESTADSILAAALGSHPDPVLIAPMMVRGHCVAFLYADTLLDEKSARERASELAGAALEALERLAALTRR